jgi:primosomal protein N' (replication factor Y)
VTPGDNQLFDPTPFARSHPEEPRDPGAGIEEGERLVRVLADVSGLSREFDYRCPARWADEIDVGSLVRFDLNGRRVAGWVTAVDVEPPPDVTLSAITRWSSIGPPADVVELARWAAHRWHGRLAPILKAASPHRMVKVKPARRTKADPARRSRLDAGPDGAVAADWMAAAALASGPGSVVVLQSSPRSKVGPLIAGLAGLGDVLVIEPDVARAAWLAGALHRAGIRCHRHPQQWVEGFTGGVVVGSRSAVWAPLPELAAVVVLDEHDEALQEERVPTWHARDVAIERARRCGARTILVSPIPSVAALTVADRVVAGPRAELRAGWPVVEVIDRRNDELGFSSLFSSRLVELLRPARRAVVMLNRKGRARLLACATCGELVRSEDGEHMMIEDGEGLLAPATGERRPLVCAICGGTTLKRIRLGVSQAAEELARLLDRPVVEISSDTARSGLDRPETVVLGTEAALRAVDGCDVVAFLDFDQELLAPRYRAGEQAMALLARAARLAGGRREASRLVIQTRIPDHPVVRAAVAADPDLFTEAEQAGRAALGWPPFGALAEISGAGAAVMAGAVGEMIRQDPGLGHSTSVLGPRHDGKYLIAVRPSTGESDAASPESTDAGERLADLLASVHRPKERVRVAVDPPRA